MLQAISLHVYMLCVCVCMYTCNIYVCVYEYVCLIDVKYVLAYIVSSVYMVCIIWGVNSVLHMHCVCGECTYVCNGSTVNIQCVCVMYAV